MGYVIAILILGLIVTVHEFGHFICAKLSGIKVLEFSVGMGPRLLKLGKGETEYSLRLIPFGGYCSMEGEDDDSGSSRSFRKQSVWKRIIVLFAGAFMNFVLGFVAVIAMTATEDSVPTMQIKGFAGKRENGSVEYYAESYKSGLRHNDIIVEMDDMHIFTTTDLSYMLGSAPVHDVEVMRDGERVHIDDVKFGNTLDGGTVDFALVYKDKNIGNVIAYSAKDCFSLGRLVWIATRDLITGKYKAQDLSGPVGVVSTIGQTAQMGENIKEKILSLLYLTALISINIGLFNLLPIPGLDGGRLLFCFIEIIRRKPVKPEHEGYVHFAGMILLFGIMIFATYNDIVRLIKGG